MHYSTERVLIVRERPDLLIASELAAQGFVQPLSDSLQEDVSKHIEAGRMVYRLIVEGKDVGFAIFNVWSKIIYLAGVILDRAHQGRGLAKMALGQALQDAPMARTLTLRTQSLRMWVAASKWCEQLYPSPDEATPPLALEAAGQETAKRLGGTFPITTAYYGQALYGQKPTYADLGLQEWWDRICSFEKGDAVICVGCLRI